MKTKDSKNLEIVVQGIGEKIMSHLLDLNSKVDHLIFTNRYLHKEYSRGDQEAVYDHSNTG